MLRGELANAGGLTERKWEPRTSSADPRSVARVENDGSRSVAARTSNRLNGTPIDRARRFDLAQCESVVRLVCRNGQYRHTTSCRNRLSKTLKPLRVEFRIGDPSQSCHVAARVCEATRARGGEASQHSLRPIGTRTRNSLSRSIRNHVSPAPQVRQNALPGVTGLPQLGQAASSRAPQSSQKRAPASFSAWHRCGASGGGGRVKVRRVRRG
jgi:hypothetical protein